MKTFIYTNSLLVEKNPLPYNYAHDIYPSQEWQNYEDNKETLPVSGTGWIEGQEYTEGKDFEVKWQERDRLGKWFTLSFQPDPDDRVSYRQVATLISNTKKKLIQSLKDSKGFSIDEDLMREAAVLIPKEELTEEKEERLCLKVENIETGEKNRYGRVKVIGNLRIEASKDGEGEKKEEGWISVKDRLPDLQVDVLVCIKKFGVRYPYSMVATYEYNLKDELVWWVGEKEFDWNNANHEQITHWMSLPEPPKFITQPK